jgi:predicted GIY-YIG superfamily endonuclease
MNFLLEATVIHTRHDISITFKFIRETPLVVEVFERGLFFLISQDSLLSYEWNQIHDSFFFSSYSCNICLKNYFSSRVLAWRQKAKQHNKTNVFVFSLRKSFCNYVWYSEHGFSNHSLQRNHYILSLTRKEKTVVLQTSVNVCKACSLSNFFFCDLLYIILFNCDGWWCSPGFVEDYRGWVSWTSFQCIISISI